MRDKRDLRRKMQKQRYKWKMGDERVVEIRCKGETRA